MKHDYDYIIIGSGFGGSVSALRLAEKGYKVLVIEKGKRFLGDDFAKTNWNLSKWLWLPQLGFYGIQKLTFLRHASILSGVGVGGGSLVYANTLPKPKAAFYKTGSWANLEDWEKELAPHYQMGWKMLGAEINPNLEESDLALKSLATKMGKEKNFEPTKVSVFFGEAEKTVPDPFFNGKGPERTGCTFCGACMTGCRHNAKNTLDKNYLYLAEQLGVKVISEHKVTNVIPVDKESGKNGFSITFKPSTRSFGISKTLTSKSVIFAGGVLGSIPLLLKLKKQSLPNLSPRVGEMIRTNNEALIMDVSLDKDRNLSKGIAIGSILDLDENSHLEPVRYGEGSGFWRLGITPMILDTNFFRRIGKMIIEPFKSPLKWLKLYFIDDFAKRSTVLLFMQHLDSTLKLKGHWLFGYKSRLSTGKAPTPFIPEAHKAAHEFGKIINGKPVVLFTETLFGTPSTAHILGGACIGKDSDSGVIDSKHRVFGYENMYVFDGSAISANPGVNPALSITAMTERGMGFIQPKIN
ncbi:MAG: FAD-dependent oxidoreductase [Bacteroidales bacterium]|jgi:cholesterol oxidase|nr:FAD-dependent oxidoreductase [Bacteroidales bacterium]